VQQDPQEVATFGLQRPEGPLDDPRTRLDFPDLVLAAPNARVLTSIVQAGAPSPPPE
jgi:hypothetical protein